MDTNSMLDYLYQLEESAFILKPNSVAFDNFVSVLGQSIEFITSIEPLRFPKDTELDFTASPETSDFTIILYTARRPDAVGGYFCITFTGHQWFVQISPSEFNKRDLGLMDFSQAGHVYDGTIDYRYLSAKMRLVHPYPGTRVP